MSIHVDYAEILDLFVWTMDTLTRPTMRNLLAGYEEYAHRPENIHLFLRLEKRRFIEQTGERGREPSYRIAAEGVARVSVTNPRPAWERSWDGAWRVVTFDVPEVRRKDRQNLWRALRARKLGLLQRSVWVWPHPVQPFLEQILQAEGVPECFCGFTARDLFLCTNAELVAAAWDWEEINRAHCGYLQQPMLDKRRVAAARDLPALARLARIERRSYQQAFALDPLLPRDLRPKLYPGLETQARHEEWRRALGQRFRTLAND
jgi:DNA-binding transcriptional regulator PaaX